MAERCPHCDCPNRHCACVLRERLRNAEKSAREGWQEAAFYRELFEQAAGAISARRSLFTKPRGEDERRLLALVDQLPGMGRGTTKGRLDAWGVNERGQSTLFPVAEIDLRGACEAALDLLTTEPDHLRRRQLVVSRLRDALSKAT